jgi:hypothetical protein
MGSKQHDHDEHIKGGNMLVKLSVEFSEPNWLSNDALFWEEFTVNGFLRQQRFQEHPVSQVRFAPNWNVNPLCGIPSGNFR